VGYPPTGISIGVKNQAEEFQAIVDALKVVVATLRDADVQFVLGGSLAAWARGAPQSYKDLDIMVRPEDAERALAALEQAGMRTEHPPEEWLYKAWCGEMLVDLIFGPSGLEMDDAVFARAETIPVESVSTPVMAIEDVLVTKLMALDEHALNYTQLLGITRALREQIDWRSLEQRTHSSPFAKAFFTLVRELKIAPGAAAVPASGRGRVRVVSS
jgi:Uncharacterised nucleotidyltransferase